ncbi:MAG: phage major capsid protein [Clostridia bacterium]|nr:phage major capsid protein [Clostridia bacterium]
MTITELRTKRAKAWEAAKAYLDSHRTEKGTLSAEDDAVYSRMETEITDLSKEISRLERLETMDAEMSKATSTPITAKPDAVATDMKTGRDSENYKTAFWNTMRTAPGGIVRNALTLTPDTDGGYLVPDTFEKNLVQTLNDTMVIRKLAHVFKTASGSHKIPVLETKAKAAWTDEGETIAETNETFGQKNIGAHKLTALIKVSDELLNDSAFDLEAHFRAEFAARMGEAEEEAFITGDGVGKPFGILHNTEGAEVGVTTASATAITADELIKLYYSLRGPYRTNAVWILNDATVAQIRTLKDSNGQYIWQTGLKDGTPDTLLGKQVITTPYMPIVAGGAKPVAFGDFRKYWIGDREGITFKRLNELYAANNQVGFLASKRLDARVVVPEGIKVLQMKGTTSGT